MLYLFNKYYRTLLFSKEKRFIVETTNPRLNEPRWHPWLTGFAKLDFESVPSYMALLERCPEFKIDLGGLDERGVRERLSSGHECYLLKGRDDVVGFIWTARGKVYLPYIGAFIYLPSNVIFSENINVAVPFRGRNLAGILKYHAFSENKKQGCDKMVSIINAKNIPMLRAAQKTGQRFSNFLTIYYILGVRLVIQRHPYRLAFVEHSFARWKSVVKKALFCNTKDLGRSA